MFNLYTNHQYTLATLGLKKKYDGVYNSRQEANKKMYEIISKLGIKIVDIWDDHHDKTYICNNGAKFFIHRM